MKLMIGGITHETNTFSPVPTPIGRFCPDGKTLLCGDLAASRYRGTATCMGAFIEIAEAEKAQFEIPVAANAPPSGLVSREAFETMCGLLVDSAARTDFDGLLLSLHGAMAVEGIEDGEGEILRRIRAVRPHVPIAVALDMHANISAEMVALSTVITGFHLYPHLDQAETGRIAASILLSSMKGEVAPTMAWGRVPMLPHTIRQGTHEWPNKDLQAKAAAWEASGKALSANVFTGFNLADVSCAGLSAVVVTDGDPAAAREMVDELLDMAWSAREGFRFDIEPLDESISRAKELGARGGPVFLIDHYDNCGSGGTMDTTAVLAEIIRQGLEDVAFFGICDPEIVKLAIETGVGSEVECDLGGRSVLPSLNLPNPPLRVRGRVKTISDGVVQSRSPASFGVTMSMGRAVVIDTGNVEIVVVSKQIEPFSIDMLATVGIDARRRRFVAIKSRLHWREDLSPLAVEVVACAGLGVCTSDYSQLNFNRLPRPIYPIDPDAVWARPRP